jgi:hypothetical protein
MYKSRPGYELLRYLIFSIGQRIPKPIRIIILLVLEFIFVYNIYFFVDNTFDDRITPAVSQEDRYLRNIDELPIRYRRYYAHKRGD